MRDINNVRYHGTFSDHKLTSALDKVKKWIQFIAREENHSKYIHKTITPNNFERSKY